MIVPPIAMAQQITAAYRPAATGSVGGPDFASMIGNAAHSAMQTMHQSEQVTAAGVAGKADTQAVVQALTNAELTMQTVVAVRDKILTAYNDVMHMNI
jgi:flagellar hook-basal body complex protein FliE